MLTKLKRIKKKKSEKLFPILNYNINKELETIM